MFTPKKLFLISIIFSLSQVQAISVENDIMTFNTYGHVGQDFGSNFNYHYDEKTKIVSKSSVRPSNNKYVGGIDSAYIDRKLDESWKIRVGRLPLIDNVDYQNLGEDIKKIAIDDKINNYDGINIRYNEEIGDGTLYINNIFGRFKTTRNDDSYYDNVIGGNVSYKTDSYKIRFGHSIIEPNINRDNFSSEINSKGQISSVQFNYFVGDFKHSNEIVRKNYYTDEKVIQTVKTNLTYTGMNRLTPYAEFVQEIDQWNNGQKVVSSGFQYQFKENLKITNNYKKVFRTFSDYEDVNQENSDELIISLGLTLKY